MTFMKKQAARHSKHPVSEVKIDTGINEAMFVHGMKRIPRKLKIKLIIDDKLVLVVPTEKEVKKEEIKKKVKAKEEKKIEKKEAAKAEKVEAKKESKNESKDGEEKTEKTEKPKFDQKQLKGSK